MQKFNKLKSLKILLPFLIITCGLFVSHTASAGTFTVLGANSSARFTGQIDSTIYPPSGTIHVTGSVDSFSNINSASMTASTPGSGPVQVIPTVTGPYVGPGILTAPSTLGAFNVTYVGTIDSIASFVLPLSCDIPLLNTSCNIGSGWSFMNVSPGAYLTQDGVRVLTYTSGSPDAISLNVPYSSSLFALYDSVGAQVGSRTVSAVCTSGTSWGGANNGGCLEKPKATLTASSTSVSRGSPVTLTWSSTNATSCFGYNFTVNSTTGTTYGSTVEGYTTIYPTGTNSYRVICSNAGSSVQSSVSITVY